MRCALLTDNVALYSKSCNGSAVVVEVVRHWSRRRCERGIGAIGEGHEGEDPGAECVAVGRHDGGRSIKSKLLFFIRQRPVVMLCCWTCRRSNVIL